MNTCVMPPAKGDEGQFKIQVSDKFAEKDDDKDAGQSPGITP